MDFSLQIDALKKEASEEKQARLLAEQENRTVRARYILIYIDPIYKVLGMLCTDSIVTANPHQG